mmetsp:Transcript_4468/g.11749  ORF Transcript_4468/g.11749 Transcript_4468/m.11749 type:complete len:145 (+) Transcript_4468:380-814(+)
MPFWLSMILQHDAYMAIKQAHSPRCIALSLRDTWSPDGHADAATAGLTTEDYAIAAAIQSLDCQNSNGNEAQCMIAKQTFYPMIAKRLSMSRRRNIIALQLGGSTIGTASSTYVRTYVLCVFYTAWVDRYSILVVWHIFSHLTG